MNRDYLGSGLRFPLGVDRYGRLAASSGEQRVEESIALILGTRLGERPMLPRWGCRVHDEVFRNGDGTAIGILKFGIREALTLHETRIDVLDVDIQPEAATPGLVLVRISYRIRANNAIGNLVHPFYLREGA